MTTIPDYIKWRPEAHSSAEQANGQFWKAAKIPLKSFSMRLRNSAIFVLTIACAIFFQIPLIHTGFGPIGWMEPEIWQGMYQVLVEQGLVAVQADVRSAYSMLFLKSIYEGIVQYTTILN